MKALSKELMAVMLIADPVQRAKEAADLYKKFSDIAKQYAGASGGGQSASAAPASAPSTTDTTGSDDTTDATDASATTAQAASGDASTTDATTDAAATSTAGVASTTTAPAATTTPATSTPAAPTPSDPATPAATPTAPAPAPVSAVISLQGATSSFHADPIMEEIKTFANAAKMIYDSAVQQAKQQHADQSKLQGTADEMSDAKKTLDQAAKDVEGSPDGLPDSYTATGGASAAPSTTVVSLTA